MNSGQRCKHLYQLARARIRCASANGEWAIEFLSNRIQIVKQATETHGANLGDLDAFCSDASYLI